MSKTATLFLLSILSVVLASCYSSTDSIIDSYSFLFATDRGDFVLDIEVIEGQPQTNSNLGTKIIKVKQDSVVIAKMETMRLADYSVGEGLQYIEHEDNLLVIQQSFDIDRYIVCSILFFEYSEGKMLLNKYEEHRFNRFDDEQNEEVKVISMQELVDMNEVDDEIVRRLYSLLFPE